MKSKLLLLTIVFLIATACGQGESEIKKKKAELKERKTELQELKAKIVEIETKLGELDSTYGKKESNAVLITTVKIEETPFEHKIEVRGAVASRKNILISPETSGKIEAVKVTEGQRVSAGQTLAILDGKILRNSIAEVQTMLELAKTMFEKQERLYNQNIGTEVQYLQAKNNKKSLERKLATLHSQLSMTIIKAPFSGVIDQLNALEGEMAKAGFPLIRMVNPNNVYIKADVSERFISSFKKGDNAEVYFPSQDKHLTSSIVAVSSVINGQNRTFEIEVKLPKTDFEMKPNQVVVLNLKDYQNDLAHIVPTKVIQKDNKGNFVFVVENATAKKVHVTTGKSFNNQTEILTGLELNTIVANKGYRELAEGVKVRVAINAAGDATTNVATN